MINTTNTINQSKSDNIINSVNSDSIYEKCKRMRENDQYYDMPCLIDIKDNCCCNENNTIKMVDKSTNTDNVMVDKTTSTETEVDTDADTENDTDTDTDTDTEIDTNTDTETNITNSEPIEATEPEKKKLEKRSYFSFISF